MTPVKLLLVDDVRLSVEIAKSFLEDAGCEVLSAANGEQALEIIRREKPDLLITDLHMPKMSGDELCRTVKSDPALSRLPVVILTSDNRDDSLKKCETARCDGVLHKPFNKGEIIETVRQYINIICRRHKRASVKMEVLYNFRGEVVTAQATDISRGGMFVRGDKCLPLGTSGEFSLTVEEGRESFTLQGEVARVVARGSANPYDGEPGMGIRFLGELPQPLLLLIDRYVELHPLK